MSGFAIMAEWKKLERLIKKSAPSNINTDILKESYKRICFTQKSDGWAIPSSMVVGHFNPEKNGIKAVLVSNEADCDIEQLIQNPQKSFLGKIFYKYLNILQIFACFCMEKLKGKDFM